MSTCRACGRDHNPLWRCEDARIADGNVTPARNVTPQSPRNVTCAECDRLRAKLIEVEAELKSIKAAGAKRVKAYRERRAKS